MDGKVGGVNILPDQIQVVNAVLILIFIPIFDKGLYPLASKDDALLSPIKSALHQIASAC